MRSKILFLAIVAFWIVMNCLLWESQWGAHSMLGNEVPPEVVWEKILTAPDTSSLDIFDHDKKVGICHWIANVGKAPLSSNKMLTEEYTPDDIEEHVTGYSLTFEGNATLSNSNRLRFETSLDLSTNKTWQTFHLRISSRPNLWDVRAVSATEKLVLRVEGVGGNWQKILNFSDLRDPEALWTGMGGSAALAWMAGASLSPSKESLTQLAGSVHWVAHEDWIKFGHNRARAYHLETVFMGRRIHIFTSRVGEILWVEFPNKITFQNEAFEHF